MGLRCGADALRGRARLGGRARGAAAGDRIRRASPGRAAARHRRAGRASRRGGTRRRAGRVTQAAQPESRTSGSSSAPRSRARRLRAARARLGGSRAARSKAPMTSCSSSRARPMRAVTCGCRCASGPPHQHHRLGPRERAQRQQPVATGSRIDTRAYKVTLIKSGKTVFSARIGVGQPQWPTPKGEFYIRAKLEKYGGAGSVFGPVAFITSATSPTLTDWPGGGIVGVHGTNTPGLIPGRISPWLRTSAQRRHPEAGEVDAGRYAGDDYVRSQCADMPRGNRRCKVAM